jgi:GR25 family glycosyltransferase involved in LPS biosynthesis
MLPRTFYITLKETPLRYRSFIESANLAGISAEPFFGIFGKKYGLSAKYPNILESSNDKMFLTDGAIGCTLSHLTLWKTLSILPENEFFILEDDALFVDRFKEKFQSIYEKLPPNWEFVYVGWIPFGHDVSPIIVDEGISIRLPSATHAYMVKKSALEKLIDAVVPIQSPLDLTLIHKLLPSINYFVCDPSLVSQKSYLNTNDAIWTSLVYDWKNDMYGCKKKLLKEISLTDGWHNAERNDTEIWRWSKDMFLINIPKNIDSITLSFSTPINNNLNLSIGDNQTEIPLVIGHNELEILTNGGTQIIGRVEIPFIPSQKSEKNTDTRTLGICLKQIIIKMGATIIPIELSELGSFPTSPISFKL